MADFVKEELDWQDICMEVEHISRSAPVMVSIAILCSNTNLPVMPTEPLSQVLPCCLLTGVYQMSAA